MVSKKRILNKIYKYLKNFYPDKLTLAFILSDFCKTHGQDKTENLYHFTNCWEKMRSSKEDFTHMIQMTLAHDMGIAFNSKACPRTSSYSETYVNTFFTKMKAIETENKRVLTTPIEDLPLLIGDLKYESSCKILANKLKESNHGI